MLGGGLPVPGVLWLVSCIHDRFGQAPHTRAREHVRPEPAVRKTEGGNVQRCVLRTFCQVALRVRVVALECDRGLKARQRRTRAAEVKEPPDTGAGSATRAKALATAVGVRVCG